MVEVTNICYVFRSKVLLQVYISEKAPSRKKIELRLADVFDSLWQILKLYLLSTNPTVYKSLRLISDFNEHRA